MSTRKRVILLVVLAAGVTLLVSGYFALPGLLSGPLARLEAPESLVLYSIDGRDFESGQEPQTAEKFHGYPVLGKLAIEDVETREEILEAVKRGVAYGIFHEQYKCFWPRHGLRMVAQGEIVDLVICFECNQLLFHLNTEETRRSISDAPLPLLNQHLQGAGIPIAPNSLED